tara:strand:- start:4 stop:1185 length:1182 start_codon:yes stop_codon:yes gene_type:complete
MPHIFSKRIEQVPPSFLREIFKIISDKRIISFAAGLPNPDLFPVAAFAKAAQDTLDEGGKISLQYGATDGIPELHDIIARSYKDKDGIEVRPDQIIITNGSQQGLDLLGKVLVDEGDSVAVENPTYIAAIQALSLYQPRFVGIPLLENGIDVGALRILLETQEPKLLYTIPNFQNPTGLTYDNDIRKEVAKLLENTSTTLIEDDPYGEIRFEGERRTPFATYTENVVMLGSFSKILAPGLRLGWIVARDQELYTRLEVAKQASDLHTSTLIQHLAVRYYNDNNADKHVVDIALQYKKQKDAMVKAIDTYLGTSVSHTNPEGGMFLWATLPGHIDTAKLFPLAIEEGVAFVPGESFFSNEAPKNTMRINYTNSTLEQIDEGMQRLARAIERYNA